jgi:activator of HSP90 ATPase
MPKTIEHIVRLPAPPDLVYRTYLDPRRHLAACGWGERAKITKKVGGWMQIDTEIWGRFLQLTPGRMIVQTWRGRGWSKRDASVLVLALERAKGGTMLRMTHVNVPDAHARGIRAGWQDYYWKAWRAYFRRLKRK